MTKREVALRKEVYSFRRSLEERFNWKNHPYCFYVTCNDVSNLLRYYLIINGFKGDMLITGEIYIQPSKQYEEFYHDDTYSDMRYNHIVLIDLENNVYIDMTRDQFFPYKEDQYRVIREPKSQYTKYCEFDVEYYDLTSEKALWKSLDTDLMKLNLQFQREYIEGRR